MFSVYLPASEQPRETNPLHDWIIQTQNLRFLNAEGSLSAYMHACELSPVIEVTHTSTEAMKSNLETAHFDKLINTLPHDRDFADFGLCASG